MGVAAWGGAGGGESLSFSTGGGGGGGDGESIFVKLQWDGMCVVVMIGV